MASDDPVIMQTGPSDPQRKAFYIPESLLHGAFDLDLGIAEDPVDYEFEIPFISQLRAERLGSMADWADEGSGNHPATAAVGGEEDGQWSFASFIETGRTAAGPTGARRNSRSGPSSAPTVSRQSSRRPGAAFVVRRIIRDPSVTVENDWRLVDEIEFSRLSKLSFAPERDPQVLSATGEAPTIDPSFDRLQAKQERPLGVLEATPQKSPSVVSDATMNQFIGAELTAGSRVIVSSDTVLSMLMSSSRTIFPWDIYFTRHPQYPSVLVIDKRDASDIDQLQVNETKIDGVVEENKDSINSPANLAIEATRVTTNLPPLLSANKTSSNASVRTCYVRWEMGEKLVLLVRGDINAVLPGNKQVLLRGFLEYEWGRGSMDWRQRLDVQRASVLAAELKNNSAQMSRWIFSTVLLSAGLLKIAFVSRLSPRDRTRHAVLGLHSIEPYEFAHQMGIDLSNGFGIVKTLALRFLDGDLQETLMNGGKVVVMRDPQKAILRVYQTSV